VKAHGGKYYLARQIVPILLSVRRRVTEYLEPCAFGASVFLAMPRFEREILGDVNPGVVDLWKVLSGEHLSGEFAARLSEIPYRQSVFEEARQEADGTIVNRATRFLVRCRFSRGGLGKSFAWSRRLRGGRSGDENAWATFRAEELPKIVERARGVEVTSDPCWWTVWEIALILPVGNSARWTDASSRPSNTSFVSRHIVPTARRAWALSSPARFRVSFSRWTKRSAN
jgi:site-specific DNA-adenine methylase